mmetsp:Transcript_117150/g.233434  ORF Transcript_117150/g.233434 Transcript_117150/m.233434 type:complete len:528 (-) Transcript_117150:144-1727(-)
MGQNNGKRGLDGVLERTESRVGSVAVSGRYHKLPKAISDDYDIEKEVLGSGYNGSVHLATSKITKQKYAVKGFKLHGVSRAKRQELETECEIFLGMDHPHVARLVDVFQSEDMLMLVMECMTGGELFKRVTARKRFAEKDAADATWQMLLAISYVHSHGVVHRDIKLENFLYDTPDSDHLKLIDFGFSKLWEPNTKMALSCGTLAYVAPEVLEKSYTSQCDLWSLGVVVFIVLFGYMPFYGSESHQVDSIRKGKYNMKKHIWDNVSQQGQDFVKKLLVTNPGQRLDAQKALEHPWIKQRDEMEKGKNLVDDATAQALMNFAKESQFRRAAMHMMAWSLTNEERAQVRQAFIDIDKGRSGAITLQEFKDVLESKFHMNHEEAQQAFLALDANQQNEIHYSEFLAAMVSSRIQMHDDLLQATFKRFDIHGTGFITEENLKEVLKETDFAPEEVEAMMKDVGGNDNKISYAEFIAYLRGGNASTEHQDAAAKIIDAKCRENGRDVTCRPKGGTNATNKQQQGSQVCCHVQ